MFAILTQPFLLMGPDIDCISSIYDYQLHQLIGKASKGAQGCLGQRLALTLPLQNQVLYQKPQPRIDKWPTLCKSFFPLTQTSFGRCVVYVITYLSFSKYLDLSYCQLTIVTNYIHLNYFVFFKHFLEMVSVGLIWVGLDNFSKASGTTLFCQISPRRGDTKANYHI